MMEKYRFEAWMAKRQRQFKPFDPEPHEETEAHHLFGKKNSELLHDLPKNWHDFISSRQNSLSPEDRNENLIFVLESIAALLDLAAEMLRWTVFKLRRNKR